ncbi:MAG: hypothetical protein DWQ07_03915 [Chloroflexi bacterium]|nr:MAG: hypothetical protein DWQ07_03915 [Chloroflexota bacterium]MBL1193352.1 hypothetical protein [Chloroflexota bacterium]NOH10643.1 hypothetical protein [Chloroflexota bacterium]
MLYFVLIPVGFLCLTAFDWFFNRGIRIPKYLAGTLGVILILIAHVGISFNGPRLGLPNSFIPLGWFLLVFGALWSVYALFIDIPFQRTYLGVENDPDGLVTTGLYALSRHPGVLGYAIMIPGLVLVTQRQWALAGGLLALGFDILHVWLQDRYFLPQMFAEYPNYQRSTPFLVPNPASVQRFAASIRQPLQPERRIQPRYAVEGVQLFSLTDRLPIGEVLDLSLSGMKVRAQRAFDAGENLRLGIRFFQSAISPTEIEIDSRVVWHGITLGGDYEMGLNMEPGSEQIGIFQQAIGTLAG